MAAPSIRSGRLGLVPFSESHITEDYLGWLNDPHLMRFSEQRHQIHTHDSAREYLRSFDDTENRFWAILEHGEDLGHIGNLTAIVDGSNGTGDLGILVGDPRTRGKGYALEAWLLACRTLFDEGLRKISAGTAANNQAMRRIFAATGMLKDGVRSAQLLVDGRPVDVVHAALFRETWEEVLSRPEVVTLLGEAR